MSVQARFFVDTTTRHGRFDGVSIVLTPVTGSKSGNEDWSRFTPSGEIKMTITNPEAAAWFESLLGKDLAISFAERPADEVG